MVLLLLATTSTPYAFAQETEATPEVKNEANSAALEKRSARLLFDEAQSYVNKTFVEFNKQKVPYDQKLEAKQNRNRRTWLRSMQPYCKRESH